MSYREFTGKSVDEALTSATIELGLTSDQLSYEVIEKGSTGFLGLGSKDAVIRVSIKEETKIPEEVEPVASEPKDEAQEMKAMPEEVSAGVSADVPEEASGSEESAENIVEESAAQQSVESVEKAVPSENKRTFEDEKPVDRDEVISRAKEFLSSVFAAMNLDVELAIDFEEENRMLSIEMSGPEMGIIIGKRGQTLDSLQYLTNLAVNRKLDSYVRVKMDTEDYRRRRKATLENLAHHVSYKVKRTKRPVSLEPMNPYERRVIHFALQHDSYVKTESEGEEPYRHVVVSLK